MSASISRPMMSRVFREEGVPSTINLERAERDGDYARTVLRTLEDRLANRRY